MRLPTTNLVSQATKIVFSNEPHASQHLKATGVEVMALNASGISGLITAKKDVILSAGERKVLPGTKAM